MKLLFVLWLWILCIVQANGSSKVPDCFSYSDNFANIGDRGLPVGWETWNPKNMAQCFKVNEEISLTGGRSICVGGNGNYHTKGSLKRTFSGLKTGAYYKVVVRYTTRGIAGGMNSRVFPVLKWSSQKRWRTLEPVRVNNGWLTAEIIHQLTREAEGKLTLDLFSGWIPDGKVYWDSVEIRELPNYVPPKPRLVRTAVIDSRPRKPVTLMENCSFYVSLISQMCQKENLDVICLTEKFNQLDVEDKSTISLSLDGEYMTQLKRAARDNQVNLVGSILENDNGVNFNTGFLINRKGKIVDTYRKAQLAMTEIIFGGTSQGDELKVIQADFGKIGILICWDYQFPEFARSLALMGAEMLFVPIAGDERLLEDGVKSSMEHVGKSLAIENRVPVVFSRWNTGKPEKPSRIVNAQAQIVASSNRQPYISATVELDKPIAHWGGSEFSREYFTNRRPELYGILSDDSLRIRTPDGPVLIYDSEL